jgi:hypothetical protein
LGAFAIETFQCDMKISNLQRVHVCLVLTYIAGILLGQTALNAVTADWRPIVQRRLPGYGHRNWIVVADTAFSAYAQASIETIVVNQNLTSVLIHIVQAFSSSKHVRDTAFLDQELQFVQESDYLGITLLGRTLPESSPKIIWIVSLTPKSYLDLTGKPFASCSSRQTQRYLVPSDTCGWIAVT